MSKFNRVQSSFWHAAAAATFILIGLLVMPSAGEGAPETSDRLDRKVKVMEKVIDEVLKQSPNVKFSPGNGTRGLVLEGFGTLFVVDANLGGEYLVRSLGIATGRTVGTYASGEDFLIRSAPKNMKDGKVVAGELSFEEMKKEAEQRDRENRAALRAEVVAALIDYGVTLTELGDNDWVAVAVFLGGWGPRSSGGIDQMVFKVKMSDLRQHSSGRLSRDAVEAKVIVE
jgi:hypothetical protein